MTDKIKKLNKKLEAAKEEYKKSALEYLKEEFSAIFADHPKLNSFSWCQFTPGFNDGDPCYFGVHADEPYLNGEHSGDYDAEYFIEENETVSSRDELKKLVKRISTLIYSIDEDVLESVYGEGRITINRDLSHGVDDRGCYY